MRRILFFILFLTQTITSLAQLSNNISGSIVDSASGRPLVYVTVHLLADSVTVKKSTFSDSTGFFTFRSVEAGVYYLSFSLAGYVTSFSSAFTVSDTSQKFIVQSLLPDAKQLAQVTIISKKALIEKSMDGIIYNVQQDLLSGGGTAIDVLRKTPMVSVGQDGSPAIRGSNNIRVYIDDKPSELFAPTVAEALRQIPAEEIVKVEVILYPSAKYDAEGTDGIIHIITRKNKMDGINGTFSASLGNRNQNSILSLNMRRNKWVLSTNTGGYLYYNKNGSVLYRQEGNGNYLNQINEWNEQGKTFYSAVNIVYLRDSLTNIYAGYRFRVYINETNRTSENEYYAHDSLAAAFRRNNKPSAGNNIHTINGGYNGKSKNQRREVKLFMAGNIYQGFNNYYIEQSRFEKIDHKEKMNTKAHISELILQTDYTQKISSIADMEAGIKSMHRAVPNVNSFEVYSFSTGRFVHDSIRSNRFNHNRTIYAAYSNFKVAVKVWQMRLGIRYEHTISSASFKNTQLSLPDFKNFIPSVLLNRMITEKHTLKLSYSKQILRPYLVALNPFVDYSDSLNQETGNPYLLPEITHRYEAGYTGSFGKFFTGLSLFYNRVRNGIEQVRLPAGNGIFINMYQNIGKRDAVGLSGNASLRKQKIIISTNFTLRYMMLKSVALQLSNNNLQFNGNVNASYKFSRGYSAESTISFNSKEVRLQGNREGWKYASVSLNKKMNDEKITLSLRTEIFNRYITEELMTASFFQNTETRYRNFFVMLGLSWKFGKKEIKVPVTQPEGER